MCDGNQNIQFTGNIFAACFLKFLVYRDCQKLQNRLPVFFLLNALMYTLFYQLGWGLFRILIKCNQIVQQTPHDAFSLFTLTLFEIFYLRIPNVTPFHPIKFCQDSVFGISNNQNGPFEFHRCIQFTVSLYGKNRGILNTLSRKPFDIQYAVVVDTSGQNPCCKAN